MSFPVVALNRAIEPGHRSSHSRPRAERGLEGDSARIPTATRLATYLFYTPRSARFEFHNGRYEIAREHFERRSPSRAQSRWSDNSSSSALVSEHAARSVR